MSFLYRGAVLSFLVLAFLGSAQAQAHRPDMAEKVSFPSIVCKGQPVLCDRVSGQGFLFARPGQKAVVLISHGSQGIDGRMYDYVDALQQAGLAALVLDHWGPRGVQNTHNDYAAASLLGANELNMAIDSLAAAVYLRGRGFEKVGSIGESQGGASAIMLVQKWVHELAVRNYRRIYGVADFPVRPFEAVIGMYGFCGLRHAQRDGYVATPFLFITGDLDDETPSRFCEQYVPWMNARGGSASIVVLRGYGHSFDAHYSRTRQFGRNFQDCDLLYDAGSITWMKTGEKVPNTAEGQRTLMDKCAGKGFYTGASGDRFVAVPTWSAFFRQHLATPP